MPKKVTPMRFRPSRGVLIIDSLMTHVIRFGGILVITAVLGIFVFIGFQIWPLFAGAAVKEIASRQTGGGDFRYLLLDEWGELPLLVGVDGGVFLVRPHGALEAVSIDFDQQREITAVSAVRDKGLLVFGSADGHFAVVTVSFRRDHEDDGKVVASFRASPWYPVGHDRAPVTRIAYNDAGTNKLAAAFVETAAGPRVYAVELEQKRTLIGAGKVELGDTFDLTAEVVGSPNRVLVDSKADGILVSAEEGGVEYFNLQGGKITLRQRFRPFGDTNDPRVSSMDFVFGDVSLVFTNPEGLNRIFSLYVPEGGTERLFGQTKEFPPLQAGADFYAASLRNKAFLIGAGNRASLRYATTESIRWEESLPFRVHLAAISGKNDLIVFLDEDGGLHTYSLDDPHPETSWKALFGKIWYEGADRPEFAWQSTGGSDWFEPKLSLVPLMVGTMKGTLYAMIFALPIAFLAAMYTSQFLDPRIRRVVKPTMEIMASLPSVVLGFLAALWLAPLIEDRVPSILCVILALPISAAAIGWTLSMAPVQLRRHLKPGFEFFIFLPVFFVVAYGAWELGPLVERIFFTVTDPQTGQKIADFRRWWPEATGTPFEQRNSLVVGFMMGFAVIPIIFTIAEDALSNVPSSLRAGSLAVGASRWQTARYIVLPTAAAGIFSAVMIGLGRAVGETMIVVMATGNTPVMDLNIFSGMRTLSANIAVELPEAPHNGTLYRTLFLGAMMLFLMTFAINTIAELLRQHLREKFKTV
jgi:phosphate transport system permease protein